MNIGVIVDAGVSVCTLAFNIIKQPVIKLLLTHVMRTIYLTQHNELPYCLAAAALLT